MDTLDAYYRLYEEKTEQRHPGRKMQINDDPTVWRISWRLQNRVHVSDDSDVASESPMCSDDEDDLYRSPSPSPRKRGCLSHYDRSYGSDTRSHASLTLSRAHMPTPGRIRTHATKHQTNVERSHLGEHTLWSHGLGQKNAPHMAGILLHTLCIP